MNKKIAALVVVTGTLAASAAALAQQANVQLYGRANLGLDRYTATGATAGSTADYKGRLRVFDAGSRFGVRGTEELGGGLKAIFLIESGVNIDTGGTAGQSGAPNPYTGTFSSRIGHVGLQGNWGQLTFGKSNVWWGNGTMEQAGVNYLSIAVPTFYGLLGRGMNVGVSRVSNVLQYSAQVGGYAFQASYSPNAEAQTAGGNTDGRLIGVTAQGAWGPFGAGYDWVKNEGNKPAAGNAAASIGHKARAGWQFRPGSQVSVIWVKSVQENGGAAVIALPAVPIATLQGFGLVADAAATSVTQTSLGVNLENTFGNTQAFAQWAKVNDITGCVTAGRCDNSGATAWMLAARYNLSRRTGVYVNYAVISNESNYNMDFVGAWMTSASTLGGAAPGLPGTSVGADPKVFGVGVMHNF